MSANSVGFDYCTGYGGHYRICHADPQPVYSPVWFGDTCSEGHSWHVWFGSSPPLVPAGDCPKGPNLTGPPHKCEPGGNPIEHQ